MPLQLFTYRRVENLGPSLRGLPPKRGRVFLVAASGDRELLARLLEGAPHDYQVRRWDEIYRSFAEALAVKNPRVQLDPPDHWLLIHALMKQNLSTEELLDLAQTGQALVRELSNRANSYKRAVVRVNNIESKKAEDN